MTGAESISSAIQEKRNVAIGSALATILLTAIKLIVGLLTGSLGILAGAADSGIDLLASLITLSAVYISDRPADEDHPYGHGKVENLSALTETALLMIISGWIIYQSIQRIFFKPVVVEITFWAFAVMAVSIVVDAIRSRIMFRTAREMKSQALEADALNFRMDMLTSAVVILGLVLVGLGDFLGHRDLLARADAVAALGVAGFIAWAGLGMARKAIDVLMDHAPAGLTHDLWVAANEVPGVMTCGPVRTRQVGPQVFVDLSIAVSRSASFEEAHAIASAVEAKLCKLVPDADVVVHVDPAVDPAETVVHDIRALAQRQGLSVHHISVQEVDHKLHAQLHVEVGHHLTLREAHRIASDLETEISAALPLLADVNTHIEPAILHISRGADVTGEYPDLVEKIKATVMEHLGSEEAPVVTLQQGELGLIAALKCGFPGDHSVESVHIDMSDLERTVRRQFPDLDQVFIDPEVYPDESS
ncbi:MAG: cation-efflux pump [Chloroflexi bacterium]|nr:cation-efflux pump [Chloroflexota bacterium]